MGVPSKRTLGLVAGAIGALVLIVAGVFGGCATGSGVGVDDDDDATTTTTTTGGGASGGSGGQLVGGGPQGGGGAVGGAGGAVGGSGGVGGVGASGGGGGGPCGYGAPTCFVELWDFDSGCPSGWTATGTNSDWTCGAPSSGPADDCEGSGNVWATSLHGNAAGCQRSYLESPTVDLSSYQGETVLLGFYHWYEFRDCASTIPGWCTLIAWMSFSGGQIEVDSGSGWQAIAPQGGYEHGLKTVECADGSGGSPACSGDPCPVDGATTDAYTCGGVEEQWHQGLVDISAHTTSSFRARFVFGNNDNDPILFFDRPGWYIDNVAIIIPGTCP